MGQLQCFVGQGVWCGASTDLDSIIVTDTATDQGNKVLFQENLNSCGRKAPDQTETHPIGECRAAQRRRYS